MKIVILLVGVFFTYLSTNAQESAVAAGGDGASAGGSVSFSVGQPSYLGTNHATGSVNEGVQQPFEMFTLNDDTELYGLSIHVYPNPVTSEFQIESSVYSDQLRWQLHDASGRLVYENRFLGNSALVNISECAAAMYVLSVWLEEQAVQTHKIIKH